MSEKELIKSQSTSNERSIRRTVLEKELHTNSYYTDHDDYTEHLDTKMGNSNSGANALDFILRDIERKKISVTSNHSEHADEVIHTDVNA